MRQAMTIAPRKLIIDEVESPTCGANQAIIDVEVVGLCGSDFHLFSGDHPYATFPQRQGHEFAGRIAELGASYEGSLRVGARVAVEPLVACGSCFACRRARPNCCARLRVMGAHIPGALAEQVAVNTSALHPVGSLSPELAALVEPVSIGYQAVRRGRIESGDQVVVVGAGPIGLTATLTAVDLGAEVLVIDKVASRLEAASRMGAAVTVDATDGPTVDAVVEWTNGDGAAVVIDATGMPAVIRSAIDMTAPSGAVVVVGISDQAVSIPVIEFSRKELSIYGSRNSAGLFGDAVALVQRHPNEVAQLVTHRFPLADVAEAMSYAHANPQTVEKAMIMIGATA